MGVAIVLLAWTWQYADGRPAIDHSTIAKARVKPPTMAARPVEVGAAYCNDVCGEQAKAAGGGTLVPDARRCALEIRLDVGATVGGTEMDLRLRREERDTLHAMAATDSDAINVELVKR